MRDPLVYHGALRVRVGSEMLQGMAAVRTWAGSLTLPVLIVHGVEDTLCPIAGSRWLVGALGSADKELKEYAGLKHEVFLERAGQDVVDYACAWVEQRRAGSATVPL